MPDIVTSSPLSVPAPTHSTPTSKLLYSRKNNHAGTHSSLLPDAAPQASNILKQIFDSSFPGCQSPLTIDTLLDIFDKFLQCRDIPKSGAAVEGLQAFLAYYSTFDRALLSSHPVYNEVKIIAKTSVSTILLVQDARTGAPFAMKKMAKSKLLRSCQKVNFRTELDILIKAASSPFHHQKRASGIAALHCAYQDNSFIYLIMDFYPGGDLLGLLSKLETFTEDMSKHYLAEIICSVDVIHRLGYAHMDIKTDNILLDEHGHIFLVDFGSAIKNFQGQSSEKNSDLDCGEYKRLVCQNTLRDYAAPEILQCVQSFDMENFNPSAADWWSVGIIFYEMLYGETPFYDESLLQMYKNIQNFQTSLKFPPEIQISLPAKNLITQLLTSREKRLGIQEIMRHPFFAGIDFDTLRTKRAAFVPELSSLLDCSFFEDYDHEIEPSSSPPPLDPCDQFHFAGYSYNYSNTLLLAVKDSHPFSESKPRLLEKHLPKQHLPEKLNAPLVPPETPPLEPPQLAPVTPPFCPPQNSPSCQLSGAESLCSHKKRVRFSNSTIFFDAAKQGDLEVLKPFLNLETASHHSSPEFLDINLKTCSGQTALHLAALEGHELMVQFLLRHGASPLAVDENLCSPLHYAAVEDRVDFLKLLVQYGGDLYAKNSSEETPLDLLSANFRSDLLQSLSPSSPSISTLSVCNPTKNPNPGPSSLPPPSLANPIYKSSACISSLEQ